MKITHKEEMSQWAFEECWNGNDTPEMRNLITDDLWIYRYCECIKDRKEMWSRIKTKYIARVYYFVIKKRPEIRKIFSNRRRKSENFK